MAKLSSNVKYLLNVKFTPEKKSYKGCEERNKVAEKKYPLYFQFLSTFEQVHILKAFEANLLRTNNNLQSNFYHAFFHI